MGDRLSGSSRKSEFGFIEEHTDATDPNTSIISYCIPVTGMRDASERPTYQATIMFKMPREKAKRLITLVKDRPDGASFAEDFLATAAPGVFADNIEGYGIRRDKMTSLWVIDEDTQRSYFGDQILPGYFETFSVNSEVYDQAQVKIKAMKDGNSPFVLKQFSIPIQGVRASQ